MIILAAFFAVATAGQQIGFWYWLDPGPDVEAVPVDALYFRAGSFTAGQGYWYGEMPKQLPQANEYWALFRYETQGVPAKEDAKRLADALGDVAYEARRRHIAIRGVQLDIDSPTGLLKSYADFLAEVRKAIPKELQLSITALLDWFRPGTAVAQVIGNVDEFVPQFYDLGNPRDERSTIAAKVDADKWGPVFNRFGKRFRVGISTFGRSRAGRFVYGDVAPLEFAANPAFRMESSRNAAGEIVLTYRATKAVQLGRYKHFEIGHEVQFILPDAESVRASVESARKMGGNFAGVIFFRWPTDREKLVMQPAEVLRALNGGTAKDRVKAVDGDCAAVHCVDLYLESSEAISPKEIRYAIRASGAMDYFLPVEGLPARLAGANEIAITLPPYCGRGRLLVGRAVSKSRVKYSVERVR